MHNRFSKAITARIPPAVGIVYQIDQAITVFEMFADGRLRRGLDGGFVGGFIHDNTASRCTESRKKGVVQVMVDLGKTVRSSKSRELGFGGVTEPT